MTDTTEFEAMEKDGWGNPVTAQSYADGFAMATRIVASALADIVKVAQGSKAFDLCTGHGVVAAELFARGASVTGLDFSAAMIALARTKVPGVNFLEGDAMDMGFPDQGFDAVTIGFGVPHLPDRLRGLAEAARVLKPGGRIAFSIWRGKGSDGSFGWLFDAVARFGDPSITLPEGPDAHMLVERANAEAMVCKAGFTDIELVDVPTQLKVSEPEALFDAFDQGAVRAASLLQRQTEAQRDVIRQYLAENVRSKGVEHETGYLVPTPSVIVSAVRR